MYTADTLIMSCGELTLAGLGKDSSEGLPSGDFTQRNSMTISEAVVSVLRQAMKQGRVTMGVAQCAKLLACGPGRVLMCVLPELSEEDVATHIQHMLIQSFCRENDIRLIMVKNDTKLLELLQGQGSNGKISTSDLSCLLVEAALDGNSEADQFVCGYHDIMLARDIIPKPFIQLPD